MQATAKELDYDSKSYKKVVKLCPFCLTEVESLVSRKTGGRPREFHKECHSAWSMLQRIEWFIERARFDGSARSRRAASMLRRRLWSLANTLNQYGRPVKLKY